MQSKFLCAVAVASLALAGCNGMNGSDQQTPEPSPDSGNSLYKGIYLFPACDTTPDTSNTVGTINIVLPPTFNGNAFSRSVNQGPAIPRNDPTTGQSWNPNAPGDDQPFDVVLDLSTPGDPDEYLMVRVLLKPGQWRFLQDGGLSGVGLNDAESSALCDSEPTIETGATGANQAKYVASFYVDLEKLGAMGPDTEIPFTIALTAGNMGPDPVKTPILIDPKVRNDGGGVRPRTLTEQLSTDTTQSTELETE